jgi:biopolymer transport protein ExbB
MSMERKICLLLAAVVAITGIALADPPAPPRLASDASPPTSTDSSPAPTVERISFLNLLTRGGWAMLPLAACSLLALALIIERGMALRRSQILPAGFLAGLDRVYHSPADTDKAIDYCRQRPSCIARIMAAAVRQLPEGLTAAEEAVADQGATEIARLRRNLRMLHGMAAITPTLGLLGTVWGMIRAFEAASRFGLGSHSETLTTGIYEALVATMTGLMIAVPALVFYYVYLGIIDRTILELNDTTQAFLHQRVDRTPSRPDVEAPSAVVP